MSSGRIVIESDVEMRGSTSISKPILGQDCVGNAQVKSDAKISAEKLQHLHQITYSQDVDSTVSEEKKVIHIVQGNGTIKKFYAGVASVPTADGKDITIDLKKRDASGEESVLNEALVITEEKSSWTVYDANLDGTKTSVEDGDILYITIDIPDGGTDAKGLYVGLKLYEDAL